MVKSLMRFTRYFGGFLTLIIFFGGVGVIHANESPIKEYAHNFVADAVNNVAPAVVRIDTEREVEHEPFTPPSLILC